MTTALTKRLARAVLIAGLALPASALLPATATFAISKAYAAPATIAEFKSVLATYGKWGTHDGYGDIWVPTATPAGWHPYPACQWVYTKNGWHFNDNTQWGSIVHHYGRWRHDDQIGWFWVPDQDWSPGWVAWRQSDQWVGWAPLPPQQDMQILNTPAFDNDKLWIFMAADKFRNGCAGAGDTALASQAFNATYPVTWFGLAPGNPVDIEIDQHWTIQNLINLITFIINIDIDTNCPPPPPPGIMLAPPVHITFPPAGNGSSNPPPRHTTPIPGTPVNSGGNSNGGGKMAAKPATAPTAARSAPSMAAATVVALSGRPWDCSRATAQRRARSGGGRT